MFPQQNQVVNVGRSAYTIIKQIGKGSQGPVYKGSSQTGEIVVIQYKDSISNFEYEILQSLIKNPKPNIIGIKAVEREITGQTVIVMELANNELYKYMIENPEFKTSSKDQRNQIFYQMVEAVKELHELGYFHRDLKPENFLVFNKDANGFIKTKLLDLGLCKQQKNQNMEHTRNVGTPFFMAPEIFNGSLIYDHRVDSWALGCIWYELITGQTFFTGNDPNQVFQNIKNATQLQIDQKIESQQIFTQQEKILLKSLILKDANNRIQVKDLAHRLQANQKNNKINPNFNCNQNVNAFKTPNSQFPQQQNINQFNQPNSFNVIQQNRNYIQPFQPQQSFNQMNDWKQKQQLQMQYEYEQKLKAEFQQQKQQEIKAIKKEKQGKQKQQQLKELKIQEEQNLINLKQMEEELRRKNEEEQKKLEFDKQKLRQLQIEQELKIQIQLEEQRKRNEEELKRKEEEVQRQAEVRLQKELKQNEVEIEKRITEQLQQEYLIKYNQELQQKEQQQRLEIEKVFSETKNKVKKLIKSSKEQIEKFISSLEEKSEEKLINESQRIIPQQYKEFQDMTQNFINQQKSKIINIEENENVIQQMDDFEQLSQIQVIEKQLNESNQQILQVQINILNEITKKYNELISQLMKQKQLKEQLENQQKQQNQQLKEFQGWYQSYNQQIKDLKSNSEKQQRDFKQLISQLDENEFSNQSIQISQNIQKYFEKAYQYEQEEKLFMNLDISNQLLKYNLMNSQLEKIIHEVKELINLEQQLNQKAEKKFQNLKEQIINKIQEFQDYRLSFNVGYQKNNKDQEQLNRLQNQGSSFLIQLIKNEFKVLVSQMQNELKQFESSLSQLQQNLNQNMMTKCQQLIQELNQRQNQLSNLDNKIIQSNQQLERIIIQQNQIVQLNEKNKEKMVQQDQQQKALFVQFQNFSHLSNEIKLQVNKLQDSFDSLKNEFKTELEKLDSQKQESEEQLRQYIEDNQRISEIFMQKFEDKKSTAQNLLQKLFQFQQVQDEKQKLFNQFNAQCNQVKHTFKFIKFTFDNRFQVYGQIRKQSCQQQLKQCLEYLQQCEKKQNENTQIFKDFNENLQGKKGFPIQKNKVQEQLLNLFNKSVQSINELHQFQNQFVTPYYKQNFDQVENEDQQFQILAICNQIQDRVENLSFENSDQFQKTLNDLIDNQKFMNKIKQNLEEISKYQKDLQQMNLQEIQQFNLNIPNLINSWFIQMLLIIIILSYQKQNLIKRKLLKAEENRNQEQRQQLLNEQNKMKDQMMKCQSYLDSKQFNELNIEELIENQRQIKESIEKELNEIKTKNRVKLRSFVKNQEVIKYIVEMTQFGEYSEHIQFNWLKQQMKR